MNARKTWIWTCVDCGMQRLATDKDGDEARALRRSEQVHRRRARTRCRAAEGCIRLDEVHLRQLDLTPAAIIKVLGTADAGYNNITVTVDGEDLELFEYVQRLEAALKQLRSR